MIHLVNLTLEEVNARQARIKPVQRGHPPNCMGTLLYLMGLREEDSFGWTHPINELFVWKDSPYTLTEYPQVLDLALWHDTSNLTNILHAGIVVEMRDRPIIRSRLGCGNRNPITDLTPREIEEALKGLGYHGPTLLKYYTPRLQDRNPFFAAQGHGA